MQEISCDFLLNVFIRSYTLDVKYSTVAESSAAATARWGMVALMARACGRELMMEFLRVLKRRWLWQRAHVPWAPTWWGHCLLALLWGQGWGAVMPATERECGNQAASAQRMGGGATKMRGIVLEPNNQHVDVFTGWPSSRVAAEQSRSPGLRVPFEPEQLSATGWMSCDHSHKEPEWFNLEIRIWWVLLSLDEHTCIFTHTWWPTWFTFLYSKSSSV